jgi:hypothetical protein
MKRPNRMTAAESRARTDALRHIMRSGVRPRDLVLTPGVKQRALYRLRSTLPAGDRR